MGDDRHWRATAHALGFFGFILLPLWLIVVGLWLSRGKTTSPEPIASARPSNIDLEGVRMT